MKRLVAGILGNVYVESGGFDPTANNNHYYGLFQYGNGREKDFLDASNKWAGENETTAQEAWMDVRFQCECALQDYHSGQDGWVTRSLLREDGSVWKATKENFENAQNIEDATLAWASSYERCYTDKDKETGTYLGIQMEDTRLYWANIIYDGKL